MSHPIATVLQNSKQKGANIESILKSLEWPCRLNLSKKNGVHTQELLVLFRKPHRYTLHNHIQIQQDDVQLQRENIKYLQSKIMQRSKQMYLLGFMNSGRCSDYRIGCFWLDMALGFVCFTDTSPTLQLVWNIFGGKEPNRNLFYEIFGEYLEFSEMYSCFGEFLTLEKNSVALSSANVPDLAYCRRYNNGPMEQLGTFMFMDVDIEENKATSREVLDSIWDSDSDDSLEVFAGSFEEKLRERGTILDNLIHDFSERNP